MVRSEELLVLRTANGGIFITRCVGNGGASGVPQKHLIKQQWIDTGET